MKKISKKQVTASLDRIADLFQNHAEQLGVPSRVAFDFAYRCDLLSDALDKMASEDEKEEKEEEKEEKEEEKEEEESEESEEEKEEKEEKESSKKARLSRNAALRKLDRLYAKLAAEEEAEEDEKEAEEEEAEEKESSKKAKLSRRAAIRELDRLHRQIVAKDRRSTRRSRKLADFDPNDIGEDKGQEVESDEAYMNDFGDDPAELRSKQEGHGLGKAAARRQRARRRTANRVRRNR